jgi:predicted ArsR family transcriptional regulator
MYDETGQDGKRSYTVVQIAAEFGVTRQAMNRHLKALIKMIEADGWYLVATRAAIASTSTRAGQDE